MDEAKVCSICGVEKPLDDFYRKKDGRLGRMAHCKVCDGVKKDRWKSENPDKAKAQRLSWVKRNPEKVVASAAKFRASHKDQRREENAQWRANNPELAKAKARRSAARWRSSLKNRLHASVSAALRKALKAEKGGERTFDLLPYDLGELMRHLESKFNDGMSWENYGAGEGKWHIDHKMPQSVFNFDAPGQIDFLRCWDLKNLQPMWGIENSKKGNRGYGFFQPALALIAANDNRRARKAA